MTSRVAAIVSFRGTSFLRAAQAFARHGYEESVVFLDEPPTAPVPGSVHIEVVDRILDPVSLAKSVNRRMSDIHRFPMVCIHDRTFFSHLDAKPHVRGVESACWEPSTGILRSRLKPAARYALRRAKLDDTEFRIVCAGESVRDVLSSWNPRGGFFVKPICGMASEAVVRCRTSRDLVSGVINARRYFEKSGLKYGVQNVSVDGRRYDLYGDVLIEEVIDGEEFTVDGYHDGTVHCVVQHKESRVTRGFFGDGLIVSPPSVGERVAKSTVKVLTRFIAEVVEALQLTSWAFHAEVVLGENGPRLVEINPRAAGGLLWKTAAFHLGVEPLEALVGLHLGTTPAAQAAKRRPAPRRVTGQFPIYAKKIGTIAQVQGTSAAREIPGVESVVVVAHPGQKIKSLRRENYVAFVMLVGATHREIREVARRVRRCIRVRYR